MLNVNTMRASFIMLSVVMLNVVVLNVVMLNVVMLSVVMLNVVVPYQLSYRHKIVQKICDPIHNTSFSS
jgi:hypothetical protein